MEILEEKNRTKGLKFYTQKTISIATFFGGPLAAGYLIRENYLALNKPDEAKKALVFGIVATIGLLGLIFMIPEDIIEKVPKHLLPLIYTGIIYYIVEFKQGDTLKLHKEFGNEFFSGWKAAFVGLVSMIVLFVVMFGFVFLFDKDTNLEIYDAKMETFSKNEQESLEFYKYLPTGSNEMLLKKLDEGAISKWNKNLEIVKSVSKLNDLPEELKNQNEILLKYTELRIKAFGLFRKALKEDTEIYNQELDKVHLEIDQELKKL